MSSSPLVSFCIATYNRGPVLLECLRKTLANGLPAHLFEILVVDNASTDGTANLLAESLPAIHLIRLAKNGGPVAKNVAIAKARGEFIVLLDDDAYPHPGAVPQMIRHFREDVHLGAAVFDVTLPDGSKEASAYPDVFIGAGTGLRRSALERAGSALPAHFFMQAEEYDLSFRLLNAGYSVQRFWDLPLTHLKTPNARVGDRTTRLDVRNNLYLLARYLPVPLCHQLAADWLARYWMMATARDAAATPGCAANAHKRAYLRGAAEGLAKWNAQRDGERHLLTASTVERLFKFDEIRNRLQRVTRRLDLRRLIFADFGKNMLGYWQAARTLGLDVLAIADDQLGGEGRDYRGVPLRRWEGLQTLIRDPRAGDAVIISNMSPVHAPRRAEALRRLLALPVVDLFSRQDRLVHGPPATITHITPYETLSTL
jgi:glycosyltransferase involved in cell wall biosynthesis